MRQRHPSISCRGTAVAAAAVVVH